MAFVLHDNARACCCAKTYNHPNRVGSRTPPECAESNRVVSVIVLDIHAPVAYAVIFHQCFLYVARYNAFAYSARGSVVLIAYTCMRYECMFSKWMSCMAMCVRTYEWHRAKHEAGSCRVSRSLWSLDVRANVLMNKLENSFRKTA